jgi:hypothetical protein
MRRLLLIAGLAVILAGLGAAVAQQIIQSGKPVPGHAGRWITNLTLGDAGPANGGPAGTGLTELNITSTLNNDFPLCINDAPITGPYHQLCLGVGGISFNAFGGAVPLPLDCTINGATAPCLPAPGASPGGVDPRTYGAVCGSSDSTAAIQQAVNAVLASGGMVVIACPMTIAGQVTIGTTGMQGGIRLTGIGPMYLPLQQVTPTGAAGAGSGTVVWPPTTGPALVCTGTAVTACLMVNASGVEIDHINFGNVQPVPPATGTVWNPTLFPWIIGTQSNTGWQGLNIHDVTFTSTSQAIDLEGTPDYKTWTGTQITLDHIWCNACLNTGVRIHRIDNQQFYSRFMFVPSGYYMNYPALGNYLRQNSIGFDIAYSAAPQFHDLNFFAQKSAIQLTNDTVTNNFGSLTFAASAVQMTNVMFNQVCQAVTMPNGNGTNTPGQFALNNIFVWGDQSSFACSAGKPLFDLRSNFANFSISQVGIAYVDTFAAIGCGTTGTGSCPAGSGTGAASLRLNDVDQSAGEYSHFTTGQPFIKAPSGAYVTFGSNTDLAAIHPATGAGKLMAPGLDGTQAYMATFFVGGGPSPIEGAAGLEGSGTAGMNETGFVTFFVPTGTQQGYVGGCTTGTGGGCSLATNSGKIFLKPEYTNGGSALMTLDSVGAQLRVNVNGLPTSCTGQTTGTLWVNSAVVNVCP